MKSKPKFDIMDEEFNRKIAEESVKQFIKEYGPLDSETTDFLRRLAERSEPSRGIGQRKRKP